MKKKLSRILLIIVGLCFLFCGLLFLFQEKLIFFPDKLEKDYQFDFGQPHEEIYTASTDGKVLHGLLFRTDSAKGLVFYLHGNQGSLNSWGKAAKTYTDLNYDTFILDYRGFGKSEGQIDSQEQLFRDHQAVYDELKERYSEDKIVVLGYSIGSGPAAKLASENSPGLLVLLAPYYSLTDLMKKSFSFVPSFLLKYKFATNEYLINCKMPVVIFHGNQDEAIYYGSSIKLQQENSQNVRLVTLEGKGHNGLNSNPLFKAEIKNILPM